VGTLQGNVTALGNQITSGDANLQGQIDTLSTSLGTTQTSLATTQAQLAAAQAKLTFLCSAGLVKGPVLSLSLVGSCP
jgi:hypothetical protein